MTVLAVSKSVTVTDLVDLVGRSVTYNRKLVDCQAYNGRNHPTLDQHQRHSQPPIDIRKTRHVTHSLASRPRGIARSHNSIMYVTDWKGGGNEDVALGKTNKVL